MEKFPREMPGNHGARICWQLLLAYKYPEGSREAVRRGVFVGVYDRRRGKPLRARRTCIRIGEKHCLSIIVSIKEARYREREGSRN